MSAPELTESEYRDVQLAIAYRQNKISKIEARITALSSDKNQIEGHIATLEKELTILNLCIDRYALLRDRENWAKRKERAMERIRRVLDDRQGMTELRKNLNTRWHELTGDAEPLCLELALMADAELYIL